VSKKLHIISAIGLPLIGLVLTICQQSGEKKKSGNILSQKKEVSLYLNHNDSARYVGMNTCKQCHAGIYKTFIETGMGKSFDLATKEKSSADFKKAFVQDKTDNFNYHAFRKNDSLYFKEFRIQKGDTVHSRTEQVNYIIGSGQHTNSHIQNVNGYLNQMPMTWYSQKKHWDLPPGFENGMNTHFTRKIGLECMSCHNGYPEFVIGSENKFKSVPQGIDCERCHGPGSTHVWERQTVSPVDTSTQIDYSIVNPAKLSVDLQFDLCQRCHLQGNAVLKEGKSFYDFKPGMKLSDFISVFLPKYKNADDEFIMASHADRLKQCACFIKSLPKENTKAFKPYKDALTCVTCHNPHVSVRETNKNVFNDACLKCHTAQPAVTDGSKRTSELELIHRKALTANFKLLNANCVSCHMPLSGSIDIPHVSVHDHYIRKPVTQKEKEKIKEFVGLFSVNEKQPDDLTRAKAYINQYDKFEQKELYLDSAQKLLKDNGAYLFGNIRSLIQLYFIKQDFKKILFYVDKIGEVRSLNSLFTKQSYDNADAWTCYRVAEANYYTNNLRNSLKWFKQAVKLAPFNLYFRNKLAGVLAGMNDVQGASKEYEFILKENPKYVSAYSNLGFLKLKQGLTAEALRLYNFGEKLDPDNEALLLNLAGYYAFVKDKKQAIIYLNRILKKNPNNQKAKMALQQVNTLL